MRPLTFIFLGFLLISVQVNAAANSIILTNPPVLYFENADKLSLQQIHKTLINALELSSSSNVIWSVKSKTPGSMVAKVVVRDKHIAYININYDSKKINIEYNKSYNLKSSLPG